MNDIIVWVLSILAALLGGGYLRQKSKARKAQLKQEQAEAERDTERRKAQLEKQASEIKDELMQKKSELDREEKEVIQSIASIPEGKEDELSEEEKQLAADQYARARARAERLQDSGAER